jgi:hypothetical protein
MEIFHDRLVGRIEADADLSVAIELIILVSTPEMS